MGSGPTRKKAKCTGKQTPPGTPCPPWRGQPRRERLRDRKRKALAEGGGRRHEGEGRYHGRRTADGDLATSCHGRKTADGDLATSRERCPETRSPRLPTRKGSAPYFCHILRALQGTWPCPKCPLRRSVHAKMSSTPSQISSRPKYLRRRAVHAEGPNTPTGAFHRAGRRLAGHFGRDQMSTNPRVTCPQIATAPAMLHSDCPLISPPLNPAVDR